MTKFYEKNKLNFALAWIISYVVLASLADGLSESLGTAKVITVPLLLGMSGVLYGWIAGQGLKEEFGLCPFRGKGKDYLWFAPLGVLLTVNLWNGVTLNEPPLDTVLSVVSMLLVGFLEEVIFRGLLFQALCSNGIKQAFVISSLTFGMGHIVNLLNGAAFLSTMLQICYAITTGFLFTLIFYKSKCLWPCILTHSIFNALSVFAVESDAGGKVFSALAICGLTSAYAIWLQKNLRSSKEA